MSDAQPSAVTWVQAYAARLGVDPPSAEEIEALLELAGVAAHASERIAAPLACWMVGRAGMSPATALAAAVEIDVRHPDQPRPDLPPSAQPLQG